MTEVTWRLIEYEDLPKLLKHRNEPDTRGFLEHGDEITAEQHRNWWNTVVRPDINIYRIAHADGDDVGLIRITDLDRGAGIACVGSDVFSEWRGCGLGHLVFKAACDLAFAKGASKEQYLWVFADNLKAVRIYTKAGFKKVGERELSGRPYHKYRRLLWE